MPFVLDKINILLLGTAGLNLLFLGVIYFNGLRKKTNIIYSTVCISLLVWIFAMIWYRSSPEETAMFWCTFLYITATFIPSLFLYFTYIFPSQEKENLKKNFLIIFSLNIIIAVVVLWPGLVIKSVNLRGEAEKEIIFSKYYWFYFLYIFLFFNYGFYRLLKKYLVSRGIEKQQILYLLLGDFLAASGAFVTNLIMPWVGYFFVNWLGQVFTIAMVGFASYAIVEYRLMDIRIVARKIFIYFGVATFVYVTFYLTIWFYNNILGGIFSNTAFLAGIFIAPLFAFGFYATDKILKIFANKYLFVSLYNYQETINNLTSELTNYIDLEKIIDLIVDTIKKTMQLDRAGVLLLNFDENKPFHYKIAKIVGFSTKNGFLLAEDNFLARHLSKTQKVLVSEELLILSADSKIKKDKQSFEKLYDHMKSIEASLCLPLVSNKKLIGIVILGSKISGDAYSEDDLELLNTLSRQASIAIENARQYKQIKEFGKILQTKVSEQTKDLQKTNDELRIKNELNQELLSMKSDFLRVVNHQLNTPISIMRGYFSMMNTGNYSKEKSLPIIESSLDRINQTVANFWDAYSLEGERMKMNPEPVDITALVLKMLEEKKNLQDSKDRNLSFIIKKPKFKVPTVWCDFKKIFHVISNLLDNAVFYTYKGTVEVSYEQNRDFLKINIKDTGKGITEIDKKKIFQKFSRGTYAASMHPDGSGLGLYIAKKIVEGNGGEITFSSSGQDQGTTFSFTLPVYKKQQAGIVNSVVGRSKIEIFN